MASLVIDSIRTTSIQSEAFHFLSGQDWILNLQHKHYPPISPIAQIENWSALEPHGICEICVICGSMLFNDIALETHATTNQTFLTGVFRSMVRDEPLEARP
jgi:hypothetical protein